jgi:hypothetical protein
MDAQSEIELARMEPSGEAAAGIVVRNAGDDMDELLQSIEAELAAQRSSAAEDHALDSRDFEESLRHALEGLGDEARAEPVAASAVHTAEQTRHNVWLTAEPATAKEEPVSFDHEALLSAEELAWTLEQSDLALEPATSPEADVVVDHPLDAVTELTTEAVAPEPAAADLEMEAELVAPPSEHPSDDSLEAVELELALQNQNLISLGFEESIHTALNEIGGEMLFQMRLEREDCQRIAAVRIGAGEEQQFALVIMPPGGGLMRVEPVEQSNYPLAMIAKSYAGLVDTFRAAA